MLGTNKAFKYELTDAHFKKFVQYCNEWIEIFGLYDWSVNYLFSNEGDEEALKDNKAAIGMSRAGMTAGVFLNKVWERVKPTDDELRKTAFHEVVGELLLRPLNVLAECRFNVDEEDLEHETHRVIRILEHIVMKYIKSDV